MTRQNGSQLVSELVLMFPAEIRGRDVKLTVNLIVNLSPLTSGSCETITETLWTLTSSSDLSLRLRPFFPLSSTGLLMQGPNFVKPMRLKNLRHFRYHSGPEV